MSLPEVRARSSARVILLDPRGRTLLFEYAGVVGDDRQIWLTPGGGIDDGESLRDAASRELAEETGIALDSSALTGPVAVSHGRWATPDGRTVFNGADWYFVAHADRVDIDISAQTALERDVLLGYRWWSAAELAASTERIYPVGLSGLLERLWAGEIPSQPIELPWESSRERIEGCLVTGAAGDALGHPVEFDRLEEIRRWTQMTLFTAEGLLRAEPGDEVGSVHRAYLDWLATQSGAAPPTGAVVRSAPFGLMGYGPERAFALAADCARLTHRHPTAAAAGAFALIIDQLIAGTTVADAVERAIETAMSVPGGDETAAALTVALRTAETGPPSAENVESLGEGWGAEEALAIATYCALVAEHSAHGLALAVNHSGDSDSTGALCGNILGAARGLNELPPPWWADLESRDVLCALAATMADRRPAEK